MPARPTLSTAPPWRVLLRPEALGRLNPWRGLLRLGRWALARLDALAAATAAPLPAESVVVGAEAMGGVPAALGEAEGRGASEPAPVTGRAAPAAARDNAGKRQAGKDRQAA